MSDIETQGDDADDQAVHPQDPAEGADVEGGGDHTSDPGGDSDPGASTAEG
jgi:hypothetical protein